ncbi:MAG: hypothetical protein JNL70_25410 [Saprospiraceae bacterium]|nr:hypothetical protein [Saprospiraceae bacterium]
MKNLSLWQTILATGLIAGTLDILAAIFLLANGQAISILKYVASGAFGKAALEGGNGMALWGLLFHFIIAMSWVILYFLAYPRIPFLKKNIFISAVIYGIVVWSVMNLVVLPITHIGLRPFNWLSVLKNMTILCFCIGLPAAAFAQRFYQNK